MDASAVTCRAERTYSQAQDWKIVHTASSDNGVRMCLQAGEKLLREHVFVHAERPADKLNALIGMTGKLFALVAGLCGEDNADAMSHHEVLLPGALLAKFVSDKLAEALSIFRRQVEVLSVSV